MILFLFLLVSSPLSHAKPYLAGRLLNSSVDVVSGIDSEEYQTVDTRYNMSYQYACLQLRENNLYINLPLFGLITGLFDEEGLFTPTDTVLVQYGVTHPAQEIIDRMAVEGSRLYTHYGYDILAYDLSDPSHPAPVLPENSYSTTALCYGVAAQDSILYLAGTGTIPEVGATTTSLEIVDYRDSANPVVLSTLVSTSHHGSLSLDPNDPDHLVAAPWARVYDVSDPANPAVLDTLPNTQDLESVHVWGGDIVGVSCGSGLLERYSVSAEGLLNLDEIYSEYEPLALATRGVYLALLLPDDSGCELLVLRREPGGSIVSVRNEFIEATNGFLDVDSTRTVLFADNDTLYSFLHGDPVIVLKEPEPAALPNRCEIISSYPNPFNPETNITWSLPERMEISLTVHDVLGREITTLERGILEGGLHRTIWDGTGYSSGIYFIRLRAGNAISTNKLVLLK